MRRLVKYIHQLPDWPAITWDQEKLAKPLTTVRHRQGKLTGRMEALGFNLRNEATLETLTLDVSTLLHNPGFLDHRVHVPTSNNLP